MEIKKAFVTGGTGFIGSFVVKSLIENGIKVKTLVRKSSKEAAISRLKSLGAELVCGDILEADSYEDALDDVSYVFHCAAVHKIWTDNITLLYKVNVDGTRTLLELAARKNAEQFIYTSSAKTIGLTPAGKISNEEKKYNLWDIDNDYGKSKFLAEEMLFNSKKNIIIKILNPAAVIGPGDEKFSPTVDLIYRFLRKKIKVSLDTCMGLVDVRDVGYAHFLALAKAKPRQRYILCAANLTLDDLFLRLSALSNIPVPGFKMPYCLAYAIAYINSAISNITRRPPALTPKSLNIAFMKPAFDGNKAKEDLGLNYYPIEITLKDTVEWLENNFLK